jgi:carbamoyl-phosphate synthase small subunit
MTVRDGALVLADGSVFDGELIGADAPIATGEVVFNTVLSGYQEVITDPSYAGQIITFTTPHIGNYGVNAADFESRGTFCRGIVVRELARRHSNQRAESSLAAMLEQHGVPGIAGIDTRRLTRILRDTGAMPGAFGSASEAELRAAADAEPGTDGVDLVRQVTVHDGYTVAALDPDNGTRIVAVDYGMKRNIASTSRATAPSRSSRRPPVPPTSSPGNPMGSSSATVPATRRWPYYAVETIEGLIGNVPIFGICLGHQLLGRAIGAGTVKLPFGHHGGNHPVRNIATGKVEITSQNHNFAVDPDTLAGRATMTHVNLNDGVCEGLRVDGELAFSVQHHPEANPGPHDSHYLFEEFADMMRQASTRKAGR